MGMKQLHELTELDLMTFYADMQDDSADDTDASLLWLSTWEAE